MKSFSKLSFALKTKRLTLRPICAKDAKALWPYVSNTQINRYMTWAKHQKISETVAFCKRCTEQFKDEKGITWCIFWGKKLCGLIGVEGIIRKINAVKRDTAELGYWLGKPFHGQGIMTEAANEVLRFSFLKMGLHKITAGHFSENAASKNVITKLGFRLIGKQKEHFYKNGKWHDHFCYELIRREWQDLQKRM